MSSKNEKKLDKLGSAREITPQLSRGSRFRLMLTGIDEVPNGYKDIDEVMAAQSDLVEPVARFFPHLVKMVPAGERPED